jgi:probable phosphomutase (TIGR03848 family)
MRILSRHLLACKVRPRGADMDEPGHPGGVRSGLVSTVLLIRHGLCDPVGHSIAGRSPGVHLNSGGRRQVRALGGALRRLRLAALYSSPLDRARETAAILAEGTGLSVRIAPGIEELDYGAWTGRTLESLAGDPVWQRFNCERAATRIPGGETMEEVVQRAASAVADMRAEHPDGLIAAVTHYDVIRALLAHWAGMPLDHMLRLEVAPGSVSGIRFFPDPWILTVNWLPDLSETL